MTVSIVIIAVFGAAILISTFVRGRSQSFAILERAAEDFVRSVPHDNSPKQNPQQQEKFNQLRSFTVRLDADGQIIEAEYNAELYSADGISGYVKKILAKNKREGGIENLLFIVISLPDGKIITAIDNDMENSMFNDLLATISIAAAFGIVALFCIVWVLSYWVIKPTVQAFEKQKRFISDASHELKTPLTIIRAGAELLEKQLDENADADALKKRIGDIKYQADKMNALAVNLVSLSKIDELETKHDYVGFDLANAVLSETLTFESVAFENKKTLSYDIAPYFDYIGNPAAVKQAVSIFCDNAVKHSDENGKIAVTLKKQGSRPILSVSNTGSTVKPGEAGLLFDRFYRSDTARAKIAGTGLGLSIVKTLAEQNNWKIDVKTDLSGNITFSIML
jgi:signal transduction histidine kinase